VWSISVCQRFVQSEGQPFVISLGIVDGTDINTQYTGNVQSLPAGSETTISCATTQRFADNSQISAVIWVNANGHHAINRPEANNITFTWLRP
jgi:hypothetical protein